MRLVVALSTQGQSSAGEQPDQPPQTEEAEAKTHLQ